MSTSYHTDNLNTMRMFRVNDNVYRGTYRTGEYEYGTVVGYAQDIPGRILLQVRGTDHVVTTWSPFEKYKPRLVDDIT